MSLPSGSKLSHYDILSPLGAGAMGEVYRARDTRLDREVAIKVLPENFARDQERLQRFAREAKSLASFSHPNVAQIHGVDQALDTHFLVLELVPGETLAERLSRGPLAVEEALGVCVQIASGLEAAHEAGVIHRDLKPGNVKLTPEGQAKVLDFGLARQEPTRERPSTVSGPLTEEGVLLGTPGYMSPEQLRCKPLDRRTDIFAFGCVLYACLVGAPAFPGESASDVIAATLEGEPDYELLPPKTPVRVRELLAKCLEKDLRQRLRDVGDARIELERAIANKEWSTTRLQKLGRGPRAGGAWRALRRWAVPGALGAAAALAVVHFAAPRLWPGAPAAERQPRAATRWVVNPPGLLALGEYDTTALLAISRDGMRVAFLAREAPDADPYIYVRDLRELEATQVVGSLIAHDPFFSPDGAWLGYTQLGSLWRAPVAGGPRVVLAQMRGLHKGSVWCTQGIITSPAPNAGLVCFAPDGGTPTTLTELDPSKGESSHRWPDVLPGERHVLCTVKQAGLASFDEAEIAVYAMDERRWKTVLRGGYSAHYAETGHLLYVRDGGIMAAPFDLQRLEVTGPAVRVVSGVMSDPSSGAAQYAVAANGTLVYVPGGPVENLVDILWVDREGRETLVGIPARSWTDFMLSPDGGRIVLSASGATDALFVYDLARGTLTRATIEGNSSHASWAPEGQDLVYHSDRDSGGVFRSRADGSGAPTMLLSAAELGIIWDLHIAGTMSTLLFTLGGHGGRDIWACSIEPGSAPTPVLVGPYDQWRGHLSPDGRWIAYLSDESGQAELYVRPYPSGPGRWQISKDGALDLEWSADGTQLYFVPLATSWVRERSSPVKLLSVSIDTSNGFVPGPPTTAFEWRGLGGSRVTSDGQRVLVMRPRESPARTTEIHAVLDWFEELRRLVPPRER